MIGLKEQRLVHHGESFMQNHLHSGSAKYIQKEGVAVSKTNKLIIMMMMMMRRRKKRKKGKWRKEGKGENNGTKISIS